MKIKLLLLALLFVSYNSIAQTYVYNVRPSEVCDNIDTSEDFEEFDGDIYTYTIDITKRIIHIKCSSQDVDGDIYISNIEHGVSNINNKDIPMTKLHCINNRGEEILIIVYDDVKLFTVLVDKSLCLCSIVSVNKLLPASTH